MAFTVDRDRCVGSAYCHRFAPDVFDIDDMGLAFVVDGEPVGPSLDAARVSARECPSLSIREVQVNDGRPDRPTPPAP